MLLMLLQVFSKGIIVELKSIIKDIADDITAGADTSYIVDVTNPICPHCGAKLTIQDNTDFGDENDLTPMLTKNESAKLEESFNKYYYIMSTIHQRLEQYMTNLIGSTQKDEYGNEYTIDKYDLLYNKEVRDPIIERFTIDIQNYIKTHFKIDVNKKELSLTILNELKNKLQGV